MCIFCLCPEHWTYYLYEILRCFVTTGIYNLSPIFRNMSEVWVNPALQLLNLFVLFNFFCMMHFVLLLKHVHSALWLLKITMCIMSSENRFIFLNIFCGTENLECLMLDELLKDQSIEGIFLQTKYLVYKSITHRPQHVDIKKLILLCK